MLDVYAVLASHSQVPLAEAFPKAKSAADRAVLLDDRLPEAYATLGLVDFSFYLDWAGAEREFKRALELNPNYATAHHWYAFYLWASHRKQEALSEIESARKLDPLSLVINADEGGFLYGARQTEQAIARLRKALELDPSFGQAHRDLALAYVQKRQFPEAVREARQALDLDRNDPPTIATVGYVYAMAGEREEAKQLLASLKRLVEHRSAPPVFLAFIYVGLGQMGHALESLEETYNGESRAMLYGLTPMPLFDPLGAEPRFQNLLVRMNNLKNHDATMEKR